MSPAARESMRRLVNEAGEGIAYSANTIRELLDALDAAERERDEIAAGSERERDRLSRELADSRELGTYHLKQIAELRLALADRGRAPDLQGLAISPPLDIDP